jgi:transcription initiation factor TFIID subunit 5
MRRSCRGLVSFHAHDGPVSALIFSPDGKTLATAGIDMTIKLWDLSDSR